MTTNTDRTRDDERYAVGAAPLLLVGGGVLAFGFLSLFIGPTLLAVAHNLFQDSMARLEA